jgi:hypothetical protein
MGMPGVIPYEDVEDAVDLGMMRIKVGKQYATAEVGHDHTMSISIVKARKDNSNDVS